MINKETRQNHPTSEIITENERQLKQLQEWVSYGEEFLNGENSEKNISDKTIAIKYIYLTFEKILCIIIDEIKYSLRSLKIRSH